MVSVRFSREEQKMGLMTGRASNLDQCPRCQSHVGDQKVCSCGMPTKNMSFAERSQYELEQYRAYKARQQAS
jgi:hypothetical protein